VYWFDATLTLIRRKLNKEKLSQAHKKHAYQRLTQAGWSHYKVTNYSISLNLILFCIIYFISNIFLDLLFTLIILIMCIKFIDNKKKFV
jgi:Fuc2NAc and GlcNAc transferase